MFFANASNIVAAISNIFLHRSSGSEFQSARGASVASATNPFDDDSEDENSK